MPKLEVDGSKPESVAFDYRLFEPCDDVAAPLLRREAQLEAPGGPGFLDTLHARALLLGGLLDVFRLLLLSALAVAAFLPPAHAPNLLLDPLARHDVAGIRRFLPRLCNGALPCKLLPAACVLTDAPCLRFEFEDAGHPLEERAVVRDDDETA